MLTVGSLFSGIGGLELGLERTGGFKTVWQVEIDPYCRKVLKKHWSEVPCYEDITTLSPVGLERPDMLIGGFPCQPHSLAGKRQASADTRDLWSEFFRIICALRPRWVVAENVPGLLSSEDGRFFGRVLRNLAEAGYDAQWQCLRASDFGAPHQRERIFIVAYTALVGQRAWRPELPGLIGPLQFDGVGHAPAVTVAHTPGAGLPFGGQAGRTPRHAQAETGLESEFERRGELAHTLNARCADTRCISAGQIPGWQESRWQQGAGGIGRSGESELEYAHRTGQQKCDVAAVTSESRFACGPTYHTGGAGQAQPRLGGMSSRFPGGLDEYHRWPARPGEYQYTWEPPRTVTGRQPDRAKRLKALGNAVVPHCAEYIGRRILAWEAEGVQG